jgi:hypothetical protein
MQAKGEIGMPYFKRLFLVSVILMVGLFSLLWVGWAASPLQAGPDLPPREKPTPSQPDKDDDDDGGSSDPAGAYIVLQLQGAPASAWAVVQWQDAVGNWHDVEGWQGPVNGAGAGPFWVAPKDFGTGPFRWAILSGPGGSLLKGSLPFDLPHQVHQRLAIVMVFNQ